MSKNTIFCHLYQIRHTKYTHNKDIYDHLDKHISFHVVKDGLSPLQCHATGKNMDFQWAASLKLPFQHFKLNISKCSMMLEGHHPDLFSTWLEESESTITCLGGIFARLPQKSPFGNRTTIWLCINMKTIGLDTPALIFWT